jgi:hypothetical protein
MNDHPLQINETLIHYSEKEIKGTFIDREGEHWYKIENYDHMPPFFMSIVSSSDHWLFISSNGGLTAGRKNEESALFPYYTDDKIHDAHPTTGDKTLVIVEKGDMEYLWEPFNFILKGTYDVQRNIYKNEIGSKIIFEEKNNSLGLTFSYGWTFSDQYGFVRTAKLENHSDEAIEVSVLDGFQNILPYGVSTQLQDLRSTLVDAYKKSELHEASGLGIFSLSAMIVDKAEPSEALKATTVWSYGLSPDHLLLCNRQLNHFKTGRSLQTETSIRAERGSFFIQSQFPLSPKQAQNWGFVAEVNQGPADVHNLIHRLSQKTIGEQNVLEDVETGRKALHSLLAEADALQSTAIKEVDARHLSNVLFNIMRGGIFPDGYQIEKEGFIRFIGRWNHKVAKEMADFFAALPELLLYNDLINRVADLGNKDFLRLAYEYLPLTFSRRHGDPSRPWNRFSIRLRNELGEKIRYYEGNWRDIFQNWEALALSFPNYLGSMILKFLNASTIDGYNPYRITSDGIDWEVVEPDDPWSYIGYWGDHQVIYLLKLLELSQEHNPDWINGFLNEKLCTFSNVPYRIKAFEQILENPFDTVDFDQELEGIIEKRVDELGADGKLVWDDKGSISYVSFFEKILLLVLTKLSNFVPEGGIWLNTQRPEWNDANNALVGNGISMVTLCYLRRFQHFFLEIIKNSEEKSFSVSPEMLALFRSIRAVFSELATNNAAEMDDSYRFQVVEQLGKAGANYRNTVYKSGVSSTSEQLSSEEIIQFFEDSLSVIDQSIKANLREDGLYHSYNLMDYKGGEKLSIKYLYEMLEGQVAVLSSGLLSPQQAIDVFQSLRNSKLYRQDQHSYLLYPDRQLPLFWEKNNLPADKVEESSLLQSMLKEGDTRIIEKDEAGRYHFNGHFRNGADLGKALDQLKEKNLKEKVRSEKKMILALFEEIFNHQAFTGRSGTFFGYEGLGSIYWHMVSKLVLAVQENVFHAAENGASSEEIHELAKAYYDSRAGLGFNKTPAQYGAFPTDPYSHTPGHAGAQQPGMTGQVKEDILCRFGELGIRVKAGKIGIHPVLLSATFFHKENSSFEYINLKGEKQAIQLEPNSLAFTYCQVPFVYQLADENNIQVFHADGSVSERPSLELPPDLSESILMRKDNLSKIVVRIDKKHILQNH